MATYSATHSKSFTMVASTVDTVTLTGTGKAIRFINTAGKAHIFFTVAQPGATPTTPTVSGDNCFVTLDTAITDFPWSGNGCVVSMITSGTPAVTVSLVG